MWLSVVGDCVQWWWEQSEVTKGKGHMRGECVFVPTCLHSRLKKADSKPGWQLSIRMALSSFLSHSSDNLVYLSSKFLLWSIFVHLTFCLFYVLWETLNRDLIGPVVGFMIVLLTWMSKNKLGCAYAISIMSLLCSQSYVSKHGSSAGLILLYSFTIHYLDSHSSQVYLSTW